MFPKICVNIIYTIYIHVCKNFSTMLDKGLRKNKHTQKRDGEIGKQTK